jgi:hypothetical protein
VRPRMYSCPAGQASEWIARLMDVRGGDTSKVSVRLTDSGYRQTRL